MRSVAVCVTLAVACGAAASGFQDAAGPQAVAPAASPQVVSSVVPQYPALARSARVSGDVVLAVTVGADGQPTDVRVTQSIPLLDLAALQAARQWRFSAPATGAAAVVPLTFRFLLRSFAPPTAAVRGPGVPQDFALQYSYTCAAGSVEVDTSQPIISELVRGAQPMTRPLTIAPAEEARLYAGLTSGGFFEVAPALPLPASSSGVTVSDRGLQMVVDAGPLQPVNVVSAPATPSGYAHLIRVRRNGSLHALVWDEPAPADAAAQQYSSIGAAVRDVITRANAGTASEPGRNVCP